MTGCVEGELNFLAVDEALSNHFDILSAACKDATDIVITSYTTEKPDEASTLYSLEDLKSSFLNLACEEVNNRKDIPLEVVLISLIILICRFSDEVCKKDSQKYILINIFLMQNIRYLVAARANEPVQGPY